MEWAGTAALNQEMCRKELETGNVLTRERSIVLDELFWLVNMHESKLIFFFSGCGNQNFSWRMECNQCKAPKPEGLGTSPPFYPGTF